MKHVQDEPPAATSSLLAKLIRREGPLTSGIQLPAVEEQRIICLPKDPLGLVYEIERDLKARGILYSSADAEMDDKGHVYVKKVTPEDVQDPQRREAKHECCITTIFVGGESKSGGQRVGVIDHPSPVAFLGSRSQVRLRR